MENLTAPFGPGCYELRHGDQLVLFGMAGNVAVRMSSLLPAPLGHGTRNNDAKRSYVLDHLDEIEYRTFACLNRDDAGEVEQSLKKNRASYLYST